MKKLKVRIFDSKFSLVDTLELDLLKYKAEKDLYAKYKYDNEKSHAKCKSLNAETIKQFLIDNNIHHDYKILHNGEHKRDGIITYYPNQIQIITEVPDDRKFQQSIIIQTLHQRCEKFLKLFKY